MYLEKIEIQGFKSFATKNTLVFPGMISKDVHGITVVVGPNGSGKSNVADGIRWVLGEQSMKTLRGKKSEDVIFAGSEKLGKLGMAEVSLFLNNEDGRVAVDYSQIMLTRRLYRDGDSEYLINNSRVRLIDVQMLLAKANFGQRSYSVVGQGMVDEFLNTSSAERKEFFDEATGVKKFQIKRDEAIRKLRFSYENLHQAQLILVEIEPRLRNLTKQIHKLEKRSQLEVELRELQLHYYGAMWHEVNGKFNEYNQKFLAVEKIKNEKEIKLAAANRDLERIERENVVNEDFNNWQREMSEFLAQKDNINKKIARINAEMEVKLEASGQFDLSWLNNKKNELSLALKNIVLEMEHSSIELARAEADHNRFESESRTIGVAISACNQKLFKLSNRPEVRGEQDVSAKLKSILQRLRQHENESDLIKLKELISQLTVELEVLTNLSPKTDNHQELQQINQELNDLLLKREAVSQTVNDYNVRVSAARERLKFLREKSSEIKDELVSIEGKLKRFENMVEQKEMLQMKTELKTSMEGIESKINEVQVKINQFSDEEKAKREAIFNLQKKAQALQSELNALNNELNDFRVSAARYETRLEDLENEVRAELGSLKEVKEQDNEAVNYDEALHKINNIKRQLEQIGSIDPETEKEYLETKTRFDFLTAQTNDLNQTIDSLDKIIKELNATIKEKFDKEFKVIAEKFEEYFKILFSGGTAKIIKVMADELAETDAESLASEGISKVDQNVADMAALNRIKFLEKYNATGLAGIDIQATPPGKKIKSVSMLSGGERALAAIALICAIISANPSPFVVLDEVDAALDEANSERLAKILDDLSHKTQFIVITHNRASMRRANILYGVTMQDNGVSKLLSVKLDEVKARNEA